MNKELKSRILVDSVTSQEGAIELMHDLYGIIFDEYALETEDILFDFVITGVASSVEYYAFIFIASDFDQEKHEIIEKLIDLQPFIKNYVSDTGKIVISTGRDAVVTEQYEDAFDTLGAIIR